METSALISSKDEGHDEETTVASPPSSEYPIHDAVKKGQVYLLESLLQKDRQDFLDSESRTPLHYACEYRKMYNLIVRLESSVTSPQLLIPD